MPSVGNVEAGGGLTDGTQADIVIYWGRTDGGSNAGDWSYQISRSSISEGPFTAAIPGLIYGPCYFYRAYATNAFGEAWADTSVAFNTLSPPGPPYSLTNTAVSNILSYSAGIGGHLDATMATFDVMAYWGTGDGGTNLGNWANAQFIGAFSNGADFDLSLDLSNLTPSTDYFYTFAGLHCSGSLWPPASGQFKTLATPLNTSNFSRNATMTFCGYNRPTPLTNFPVLVRLGPHVPGFAYNQFNPQAADLRFVDAARSSVAA